MVQVAVQRQGHDLTSAGAARMLLQHQKRIVSSGYMTTKAPTPTQLVLLVPQPASALATWQPASRQVAAEGQLAHPSTGTCARCHSQTRTRPSLARVMTRKASALPLCRAASSVLYCQRMAVTGSLHNDRPMAWPAFVRTSGWGPLCWGPALASISSLNMLP